MGASRCVDLQGYRPGDRGVSKVVGVVLMTAIVVLAGTLTGMLTGFGGMLPEPGPQVAVDAELHEDIDNPSSIHPELPSSTDEVLVLSHNAGDRFDPSQVDLVIWHDGNVETRVSWHDASTGQEEIVGGVDELYPYAYGGATFSERTVQLIWSQENDESGQVLFEWKGENVT